MNWAGLVKLGHVAINKIKLVPMVEAVADHLGETPELVSADAGYWSEDAVEQVENY